MSLHEASIHANVAVNSLNAVRSICADLAPLSMPMTDEQLRQRAQLIHSVLRARQRMQLLRDRAVTLSDALERFRMRRAEIRGLPTGVERRVYQDARYIAGVNDRRGRQLAAAG